MTGGGTGLGKAIAAEFAALGASIVIASRKDEHLDAGRAAIERSTRQSSRCRATSGTRTASSACSTRPKKRSVSRWW